MTRAALSRWLLAALLVASPAAWGDAGVLLPTDKPQPDPKVLSLEDMQIDILIDNGDARVSVRQIFASHVGGVLEGNYIFALSSRATISDFAVWDGVTRIPGVILERKRAEEIYNNLKWQSIDPGLLQVGERGVEEARRSAVFSARIVPIPGYGTKRLELEYHERIPVESLKSFFAIPLHPDAYHAQVAGRLRIDLELRSAHPLGDFETVGTAYPLQVAERTAHRIRASFEGRNVTFAEDFAVRYALDPARSDSLEVLTFRDPRPATPPPTETAPAANPAAEPGFFEAEALLGESPKENPTPPAAPRTLVLLFDNSLSMQWEKLDRSFQAMEALLRSLHPTDRFNLLLFNTEVAPFSPVPVPADAAHIEQALAFVRAGRLRGGTNLQAALEAALAQVSGAQGESYLILLGDGDATRGAIQSGRLASWYETKWKQLPAAGRPRTYVYAVGDDANLNLLRMLARNDGLAEWVRSTEPADFKLNSFVSKIGRRPIEQLRLSTSPESSFDMVYPLEDTSFAGSLAAWVGQYRQPTPQATFSVSGVRDGKPLALKATVPLPAEALDHPQLPRLWARARVDALLEKIEREGEDRASVDEIIRLARKYKFVTPYTSFLAAPRSLLRPRVIRPGDPVLRVKTDSSIVSVVALFPFGLIKGLRYLPQEDSWQTRFLAPREMEDGAYSVRLILRDRAGRVFRESKTFVISSRPPVVRVRLEKKQFRRGEAVALRVAASESTRTVVARMSGVAPVSLRWNQRAGANTGELLIPADLPAGRYSLTVTAEDIAHNIGSQEVSLDVVP
jgi:Ca-activated chloride channel family protein